MRVNFVGDVCLADIDPERFKIDDGVRRVVARADLNVANLECPLTRSDERAPLKSVYLKAEPELSPVLDLFDAFCLANNHILDYGEAGLAETVEFLRGSGKRRFGAGMDKASSFEPLVLELDGVRVALVGFSHWQKATRTTPGSTPDDVRRLANVVKRLARSGHFVVVYAHWNYEYVDLPAPADRKIGHKLIDAGAHIVIGAHPHIVQGIETYRDRLLCHSLGNFVFHTSHLSPPDTDDNRVHETFILALDVNADREYGYEVVPVHTDNDGLRLRGVKEGQDFIDNLISLSKVFEEEASYKRAFYAKVTSQSRKAQKDMLGMLKKKGPMYILSRLHRVRLQDLWVLLSAFRRKEK